MITPADIKTLYEFNSWANGSMIESIRPLPPDAWGRDLASSHGGIQGTLVHTMGAEEIWLKRWNGESPSRFYAASDFPTMASVEERWSEVNRELLEFSRGLSPARAEAAIGYRDLKGNSHSQPLWQMMQHLVNHSTYHRGQIVTMMRQLGAQPAVTDLIAFYRLPGR